MLIKIILLIILIFWLIKISRDILFWVYLWQLKEYRRDRMRAHFELQSAKRIFLNKLYAGKLLLLLSSPLLFLGIWQFFFQIFVGTLYSILGTRSIYAAYRRYVKEPVFTKKAILLCAISAIPMAILAILIYAKASPATFLFSVLLLDMLIPLAVAGVVGLLKFPSEFMKNRIIARAMAKRTQFKDVLVIGITGSYGKTSMKEFLAHILSQKLKVLATTENHNSEIGVAQLVLDKLNGDYDVFIVEMGAYKQGEIKRICDIVRPQIGILTGINDQHISLFGSLEKTIKAKYELIESLPKNGLAIFNGENDHVFALYEKTAIPKRMYALRSFSVSSKPDITAEKVDIAKNGTHFYVKIGENRESFETPVLGRHNVLNILGAALAAQALGMTIEEIQKRVKTLKPLPHTLNAESGINGSTIIDDTYSANPRGVMAALDLLDNLKGNKKIVVMYPLIELGEAASDIHRRIAMKLNKICDVCILTNMDFAREIKNNALNTDVFVIQDPKMVIQKLEKIVKSGDIVLLENRIPEKIKNALISS